MPYADPERRKAYYLEWQRKNREKVRAYQNKWRHENRELARDYQRRYLNENRTKVYEGIRASGIRRHHQTSVAEKIVRDEIYQRDSGKCHICGKHVSAQDFHLDHLVPLSRGGTHTRDNIALAHPFCNRQRGPGHLPAQLLLIG